MRPNQVEIEVVRSFFPNLFFPSLRLSSVLPLLLFLADDNFGVFCVSEYFRSESKPEKSETETERRSFN